MAAYMSVYMTKSNRFTQPTLVRRALEKTSTMRRPSTDWGIPLNFSSLRSLCRTPSLLQGTSIRPLAFVFMAALLALPLTGCNTMTNAAMSGSSSNSLSAEEFMIPAADAGIQLYVRNKMPSDMKSFSAEKTVLFVHGATYPSEIYFDLKVGGFSWMEYLASRGYDVYMLDVRGYGRSTRPASMSQALRMPREIFLRLWTLF
jgi:hypothetical protein